jgi:hypothetical protein
MTTPGGTDFEKLVHALLSDRKLRGLLASQSSEVSEVLRRAGIEPTDEKVNALKAVSPELVQRVAKAFGDVYYDEGDKGAG